MIEHECWLPDVWLDVLLEQFGYEPARTPSGMHLGPCGLDQRLQLVKWSLEPDAVVYRLLHQVEVAGTPIWRGQVERSGPGR